MAISQTSWTPGLLLAIGGFVLASSLGFAAGEDDGWDRPGPIVETAPTDPANPNAPMRIRVGEVEKMIGRATIQRGNNAKPVELSIGDRIYVGDQISVESGAAVQMKPAEVKNPPEDKNGVELTLGLNVRLQIGSNSIMRIKGIVKPPAVKGIRTTRRSVELEKGTARIRVRQNLRSPTPVELFISGTVTLLLNGSDTLASRHGGQAKVKVLKGNALLNISREGINGGQRIERVNIGKREQVAVSEDMQGAPTPKKMTDEEYVRAKKQIIFVADRDAESQPRLIARDPELDQP